MNYVLISFFWDKTGITEQRLWTPEERTAAFRQRFNLNPEVHFFNIETRRNYESSSNLGSDEECSRMEDLSPMRRS